MKDRSRHASGRQLVRVVVTLRRDAPAIPWRDDECGKYSERKQKSGLTIPVRLMQLLAVVCGAAYLKSRADEPTGMPRWPDAPGWR